MCIYKSRIVHNASCLHVLYLFNTADETECTATPVWMCVFYGLCK